MSEGKDEPQVVRDAGWPDQERVYREIWLAATPAQRLRKLQELMELANLASQSRGSDRR